MKRQRIADWWVRVLVGSFGLLAFGAVLRLTGVLDASSAGRYGTLFGGLVVLMFFGTFVLDGILDSSWLARKLHDEEPTPREVAELDSFLEYVTEREERHGKDGEELHAAVMAALASYPRLHKIYEQLGGARRVG
jgi:hypothetical protein